MKSILSLFDHTGNWPAPFADAGWLTYSMDIKDGHDVLERTNAESWIEQFDCIDGVLAAVPCTEFAVSGARWWEGKSNTKEGRESFRMACSLVRQAVRVALLHHPTDTDYDGTYFWAIENPVGRLPGLFHDLPAPMWFDPCDYAGHLGLGNAHHNELDRLRRKDGKGFTMEEVDFVIRCNAYTKKTGLWGSFNHGLEKRPVEPVRCNSSGSPMMSYGGKSEATKAARSATPMGFANAFFKANHDWRPDVWPDNGGMLETLGSGALFPPFTVRGNG